MQNMWTFQKYAKYALPTLLMSDESYMPDSVDPAADPGPSESKPPLHWPGSSHHDGSARERSPAGRKFKFKLA